MAKWNESGSETPKIETRTPEAPRLAPKEKLAEISATDASQPKTPRDVVLAPNAERLATKIEPERPPVPTGDLQKGGANAGKSVANPEVRSEPTGPPPPSAELLSPRTDAINKSSNQNDSTSGKRPAMADGMQDERYLKIDYASNLKKMNDGTSRVEKSATAILNRDDPKMNPRHDPAEKGNEKKIRDEIRLPGLEATHLISAQDGANSDKRNVVPFNPVMNRRFQAEHDRQTRADLKEKGELEINPTSIHRAKADGTAEERPIAIRLREGEKDSKGEKRGDLFMGNFSSHSERLYQNRPDGQKPTRNEVNDAYREDSKLYSENKLKSQQVKPPSPSETAEKLLEKKPVVPPGQ